VLPNRVPLNAKCRAGTPLGKHVRKVVGGMSLATCVGRERRRWRVDSVHDTMEVYMATDRNKDMHTRGTENRVEGAGKELEGKARNQMGDATDNRSEQLKGKAKELEGKAQQKLGESEQDLDRNRSSSERRTP
jgi:uncharacterized protein YjbJ (UPF0337 family)